MIGVIEGKLLESFDEFTANEFGLFKTLVEAIAGPLNDAVHTTADGGRCAW